LSKKNKIFLIIQGPLVAVASGILFYIITMSSKTFSIAENHMVSVPIPKDITSFIGQFSFPNFSVITNPDVWIVAFTIALVASIETLLCVEATDKLDPDKNITPTNRELLAQGIGNIFSGLIGGIPITQVIVRSSANIQSGGKSKMSAIIHGLLLLISVVLIPTVLNKIPLSVLAAILLLVGYKLASPRLFKHMFDLGWKQFTPYTVTVLGIVFIDLLYGIGLGLLVGIVIILIKKFQNSHLLHINGQSNGRHKIKMTLAEEVNFFNKAAILKELNSLPINTILELDIRKTNYLDYDIIEIFEEFALKANEKNIEIKIISENEIKENVTSFIEFFKLKI
jgi:MFS superfamily sulfate permease-like transporter